MRVISLLALLGFLGLAVLLFGGPMMSGALLMALLPAPYPRADHPLPSDYVPLHEGHADLSSGVYYRENEDIVLDGTPALMLRRVSISNWTAALQFGIGATHNGEWFLVGDGKTFQYVELIRPGLPHIRFGRTTSGRSFLNAMYEHRSTDGEWNRARIGWTGINWALRKPDGSLMLFRSCGPPRETPCSITHERDPDGHVIWYHRTRDGRLERIEADDGRWIGFEYDDRNRIVRAYDSMARAAVYQYDDGGRLARVTRPDGQVMEYTYTESHKLATIKEPGTDIENFYDEKGRCVRQVNHYPDRAPFLFEFRYVLEGDRVAETERWASDGWRRRYTFDAERFTTSETWMAGDAVVAAITYERDPVGALTGLALTCPDRRGLPLRHTSIVRPGEDEDQIKARLADAHCYWNRSPAAEAGR